ncbi:transport and Golgi organization 2 homolog [Neltuma alba]|uniref:transport and Golgi organization 2 homolog n=1 Tax=Neltuma alba TaxID=207710 RepID=UPI0010A355AB|nr:transport and Golgi organization 2 homolog [Prosopis alba]XP_028791283.1 transport and Golgi organization 2 homolog [Prosopis alba]
MCIVAFLWQAHPLYPLILLNNRDEYHNRATKAASWWEDSETEILGGRDELGGGTWLGCCRDGRIAFLTNVLEPHTSPRARTRGELPLLFLKSRKSPREFAEELKTEGEYYNGFNLVVGDIETKSMVYMSNRGPKAEAGKFYIQEVKPGLHVLCNAQLDSPWHKSERLRVRFQQELAKYGEKPVSLSHIAGAIMKDSVKSPPALLPHICSPDWELSLSPIFVHCQTALGVYGTRSITALSVTWSGEVSFYEMYLDVGSTNAWKDHLFTFYIQH